MKNKISFLIGFVTSAILFTTVAFANDINIFTAMKATFDVVVNGETFESQNPTVVIEGRTYLPLKETGDALGVDVKWNEKERKVEINKEGENVIEISPTSVIKNEIVTPIPDATPTSTGKAITIDYKKTAPYIKNINGKDIYVIDYNEVLYIEFAEFTRQYPDAPHNDLMKAKGNFITRPTKTDTKSYIKYDVVKDFMK